MMKSDRTAKEQGKATAKAEAGINKHIVGLPYDNAVRYLSQNYLSKDSKLNAFDLSYLLCLIYNKSKEAILDDIIAVRSERYK